jgi:transposase/transcriptional regulator with XRE-family HTH domain
MTKLDKMLANYRLKWVNLVLEKGFSRREVAKFSDHSPNTISLWVKKYQLKGIEGLLNQSRAPLTHPNQYSQEIINKILEIRDRTRFCALKIKQRLLKEYGIDISARGIGYVLKREGRTRKYKRRPKKERISKFKIEEPGELVEMDIKYAIKSYSGYWYFQYSAIDWITGIAFGDIYEIHSNLESLIFLKKLIKFYPFQIFGIQTDNDSVFTNRYTGYLKSTDPLNPRLHPFDLLCRELGITHYLIDPGKPMQNGKIERFHRICEEEFYQRETFKDLNSLRKKFRDFVYYFNNERESLGLDGLTPLEKLRTFPQYSNIKVIC